MCKWYLEKLYVYEAYATNSQVCKNAKINSQQKNRYGTCGTSLQLLIFESGDLETLIVIDALRCDHICLLISRADLPLDKMEVPTVQDYFR